MSLRTSKLVSKSQKSLRIWFNGGSNSGVIAHMESQIELMNRQLEGLKKSKAKEVKETKKKEKKVKPAPVASSSKAPPKQPKATSTRKKQKKPVADDDVLSFDQKKDLSDTIAKLDGVKLERVIQIIHEGVPEIRDVSLFLISLLLIG